MSELASLHPVSRRHLETLTDEVGIMQHAIGAQPDPAHGYCTDDVARGLLVDLLQRSELGWPAVADSARRSLRFLADAFDRTDGRFRNFRRADGSWLDGPASQDSQGRAMRALGEAIASAPDAHVVGTATVLFEQALPGTVDMPALRATASVLLGCEAAMRGAHSDATGLAHGLLAGRLWSAFAPSAGSPDWPWPEPGLTYENALLTEALVAAGRRLDSRPMVDAGLRSLDWLIDVQTAPAGHLSPIGNEGWARGGRRSQFDQQPIEATALLLAAESAFRATHDERYRSAMERAYAWFLGENDVGWTVADPVRGACHDGLTPHGVNANQGAESTLMWLMALEHIRSVRVGPAGRQATRSRADARTAAAVRTW